MHIDLDGQAVLVTGAGQGIGQELATSLARSGAVVALQHNSSHSRAKALATKLGEQHFAVQANLEDPDDVERLFQEVVQRVGRLGAVVNAAAVSIDVSPEDPQWLEFWQKTMDINVQAMAQLSMMAIDHFKEYGGGRLIHVTARSTDTGDSPNHLAQAASKSAVLALSKSLARAFGNDNVQSFAVAPGGVNQQLAKDFKTRFGQADAMQGMALDHLARPEHIAPLCNLILSGFMDDSSGATFDLNSGSLIP